MRISLVLIILTVAAPVSGGESGNAEHHFHQNDVGVFVGGTTPLKEEAGGKTAPTIGVEYERRISTTHGVVLMAEFVGKKHRRDYLFAGLYTYRMSAWRLGIGPGVELVEKDRPSGDTKVSGYFVIATRLNYVIHVDVITMSPTVGIDLVGDTKTNLVYGLTVGYGF